MREFLAEYLAEKAIENPNFFVLSGDHGYALFDPLRKVRHKQFINVGVSEQAMIGYAAGMAKEGFKVLVYGLAAFVPIRVLEFIKMDICYENLPVIILGDGAGLVYSTLGPSHQCSEDIACLSVLPEIKIFSPSDKFEMEASLNIALRRNGPSYIRIGKADRVVVHSETIDSSKNFIQVRECRSKIAVLATGSMVSIGLAVSTALDLNLYSFHVVHPLEKEEFKKEFSKFDSIITLEEHSIVAGFGSLVTNLIMENQLDILVSKIGITKGFSSYCGSYEYALKEHGLDEFTVKNRIQNFLDSLNA